MCALYVSVHLTFTSRCAARACGLESTQVDEDQLGRAAKVVRIREDERAKREESVEVLG